MSQKLYLILVLIILLATSCSGGSGGGVEAYSVGGTVTGLSGTVVLQDNGGDDRQVTADGPFTFATKLANGATYAVTVKTQPDGETCSVAHSTNTISGADVTDIAVVCSVDTYKIGGSVSDFTGTGLVLQNNGMDDLPISSDGPFTFETALADKAEYDVTVKTQPTGQECSVVNGSDTVKGEDVTTVEVTCLDRPTIFSVGPADASTNVSPTSSVSVTFSEEMDHTSTESAFLLSASGTPVSGAFNWSGYTMKFTPASDLANSTSYTVAVNTDATNSSGTPLADDFSASFATGDPAVSPPDITNIQDELANEITGWTASGEGAIDSINHTITDDYKFTRTDLTVSGDYNFLIEAVVSSMPPDTDAEAGARLWVHAHTSDLDPYGAAFFHNIQVRLLQQTTGEEFLVGLYNQANTLVASLALDWTTNFAVLHVPFRIRLMRQGDQIVLEAEPSDEWDDSQSKQSTSVTLNQTNFPRTAVGAPQEIGFGNALNIDNQVSTWEHIHVTVADDLTTTLPYWPPTPPVPILIFDDKRVGNQQGINISSYDSAEGYLTNDSITSYLGADGTTYTGSTETDPQDEYWDFTGLGADQEVTGYVIIEDISGRSRTSNSGSVTVPVR